MRRSHLARTDARSPREERLHLTVPTGAALPALDVACDAQGQQLRKGAQARRFDGVNRIAVIGGETYASLIRI